jgi:hypothetical protein
MPYPKGKPQSEESKEKRRLKMLGSNNPQYGKKGLLSPNYGIPRPLSVRKKISENNKAEKNYNWRGEEASYQAKHTWIRKNKPKPDSGCEECGSKKFVEIANLSRTYKRDVKDYKWLCRKCHRKLDWASYANRFDIGAWAKKQKLLRGCYLG